MHRAGRETWLKSSAGTPGYCSSRPASAARQAARERPGSCRAERPLKPTLEHLQVGQLPERRRDRALKILLAQRDEHDVGAFARHPLPLTARVRVVAVAASLRCGGEGAIMKFLPHSTLRGRERRRLASRALGGATASVSASAASRGIACSNAVHRRWQCDSFLRHGHSREAQPPPPAALRAAYCRHAPYSDSMAPPGPLRSTVPRNGALAMHSNAHKKHTSAPPLSASQPSLLRLPRSHIIQQ